MSDANHYHVYLAVPGVNFCWGTVTGVINSTKKHTCHPFNGGMGFSGVEDFNLLWTDAHNCYDRGEITHFAMMHGDIAPDTSQRWLDILIDEMESHNAAMVSALSPIKDSRGLLSSGICDLDDRWTPFKRFTIREVLNDFPDTFDNAAVGYPDKPLLHNTGLWVCDLRNPVFHALNADGELDLIFKFPDRSVRGKDGQWAHQRESEDWLFSRELWLRGVRNTFITKKVKLSHHGKMTWNNFTEWGTFNDGDENTADKWRVEKEKLPLATLQMLEFELGTKCNLADQHADCPNKSPLRFAALDAGKELDDDTIVASAAKAYNELGFTGMVGWIYYNEPLLESARMFRLMGQIRAAAPKAKYILWTNGTLIPEACEAYRNFAQIVISGYNEEGRRGFDRLAAKGIAARYMDNPALDGRLVNIAPKDDAQPCLRPFVELIFDAYGNSHLCCYDWQGKATLGNVHKEGFDVIAQRWRDQLPGIAGQSMNGEAPPFCKSCGFKWDKYQCHDEAIVDRARRFRAKLQEATV